MPIPDVFIEPVSIELKNILKNKIVYKNDQNIEIEARLGTITNILTSERLQIETLHPVTIKASEGTKFKTGVALNYFSKIKNLF